MPEQINKDTTMRTCTIVTQLKSPITDKLFITNDIQNVIDKHIEQIKGYAWIIHDKDVISEQDMINYYNDRKSTVEPSNPMYAYYQAITPGDPKPAHVHIILSFKNVQKKSIVAKWFDTDIKNVKPGYQHGNRIQHSLKYLLHLNCKDKYIYDTNELHISDELSTYLTSSDIPDNSSDSVIVDYMLNAIRDGKSLEEVRSDPAVPYKIYIKNKKLLQAAVDDVRLFDTPMPSHLINIYIEGASGTGKTILSTRLARAIFKNTRNPYFSAGTTGVALQNYQGEPCIIWGDTSPHKLLDVAGGSDIFELLDPHNKEKIARPIKYGSVILKNSVNIFTSTIKYYKFFSDLAQGLDETQIYRRMQVVIKISDNDIQLFAYAGELSNDFNKKYRYISSESILKKYIPVLDIKCSLSDIIKKCNSNFIDSVFEHVTNPIADFIKALQLNYESKNYDDTFDYYEYIKHMSINSYITNDYTETTNGTITPGILRNICDNSLAFEEFESNVDKTINKLENFKKGCKEIQENYFNNIYPDSSDIVEPDYTNNTDLESR